MAYHAWSKGGRTFSSKKLYKHLVEVVISIAFDLAVPPEPPVNTPTLPEIQTLGSVLYLAEELETHIEDKFTEFKKNTSLLAHT